MKKFKFEIFLIIIFIIVLISSLLNDKDLNFQKQSRNFKSNNIQNRQDDVKILKEKFIDIADINYCSNIETIKIFPYDLDFMNEFNKAVNNDQDKINSWNKIKDKTIKLSLETDKKIAIMSNLNADVLFVCQQRNILYDEIENLKNIN